MKSIDINSLNSQELYRLLTSTVTPRPIAFVSSKDEQGINNLSPFSFFNIFSVTPPILVFSPVNRISNNSKKDTLNNVIKSKECVIALANKKIVYVLNCGGKPTASGTARLLAAQSSTSGRKVILCDKTGQSEKELEGKLTRHISGCPFIDLDDNIAVMTGNNASSFFTISNFNKTIEDLFLFKFSWNFFIISTTGKKFKFKQFK